MSGDDRDRFEVARDDEQDERVRTTQAALRDVHENPDEPIDLETIERLRRELDLHRRATGEEGDPR